ncbi:MAG: DUF4383 domain-containing protein [Pseudonocardiaceae bacterium]
MTFASPEDKFGIKLQTRDGRTLEQNFSMIAGSIYFVGGIIGFFYTGFSSNLTKDPGSAVFGLFMVNPFHNIVHLAVGALWLLGAFALTAAGNEGLNIAIGGFYVLAAVLGFLGYLSFISVGAGNDPDNYLHLVTGVLTLVFGSGLLSAMGRR